MKRVQDRGDLGYDPLTRLKIKNVIQFGTVVSILKLKSKTTKVKIVRRGKSGISRWGEVLNLKAGHRRSSCAEHESVLQHLIGLPTRSR
jgi:hypothetical protein